MTGNANVLDCSIVEQSNLELATTGTRTGAHWGMSDRPPIFTVGHSTRSIAEFAELLRVGQAELVVDVRSVPRSRRNPQYDEDLLANELAPYQIGYERLGGLGGLRRRSRNVPSKINGFW